VRSVTRNCYERTTARIMRCPSCGQNVMEAVSDGEMTNFRCVTCGACWHIELGWVSRVDPATCPGCEHQAECVAGSERPALKRRDTTTVR
jgi:DNA-directed RNA polymerase subunit RPC12/RpoP